MEAAVKRATLENIFGDENEITRSVGFVVESETGLENCLIAEWVKRGGPLYLLAAVLTMHLHFTRGYVGLSESPSNSIYFASLRLNGIQHKWATSILLRPQGALACIKLIWSLKLPLGSVHGHSQLGDRRGGDHRTRQLGSHIVR